MPYSNQFDSKKQFLKGRFSMDAKKMNKGIFFDCLPWEAAYVYCNIVEGGSILRLAYDHKRKRRCIAKLVLKKSKEPEILRKVQHEFIITYICEVDRNEYSFLLMELGECSLSKYIKDHHEDVLSSFLKYSFHMVQSLAFLHRKGIIHRDIKPSNYVLVGGIVKLIDFDRSTYLSDSAYLKSDYACGSPELLCKMPYNHTIDIWDLGISFGYMIEGSPIVIGQQENLLFDILQKFDRLPKGEVPEFDAAYEKMEKHGEKESKMLKINFDGKISKPLAAMIESCLKLNPSKRISSAELANLPVFSVFNNFVI